MISDHLRKQIHFELSNDEYDQLSKIARVLGITLGGTARRIVRIFLQANQSGKRDFLIYEIDEMLRQINDSEENKS